MKLDEATKSGRYNIYTIKNIYNLWIDEQHITAKLSVVDDSTENILMNISLNLPLSQINQFLNPHYENLESTIYSSLTDGKFLEPTKDFLKELKESYYEHQLVVGLSIKDEVLDLGDDTRYLSAYPSKGYFESFKKEKEFRKEFPPDDNRVNNWGRVYEPQTGLLSPIDSDILEIVRDLNRIDFIYTKGESCSGTPRDHQGEYVGNVKGHFGIGKEEMGFIILRTDTTNNRYLPFQRGLENLCEATLVEMGKNHHDSDDKLQKQEGIKNRAIKIAVPRHIKLNKNHPNYRGYLTNKWNYINQFIKKFIGERNSSCEPKLTASLRQK